jgi:hypothetical protein
MIVDGESTLLIDIRKSSESFSQGEICQLIRLFVHPLHGTHGGLRDHPWQLCDDMLELFRPLLERSGLLSAPPVIASPYRSCRGIDKNVEQHSSCRVRGQADSDPLLEMLNHDSIDAHELDISVSMSSLPEESFRNWIHRHRLHFRMHIDRDIAEWLPFRGSLHIVLIHFVCDDDQGRSGTKYII